MTHKQRDRELAQIENLRAVLTALTCPGCGAPVQAPLDLRATIKVRRLCNKCTAEMRAQRELARSTGAMRANLSDLQQQLHRDVAACWAFWLLMAVAMAGLLALLTGVVPW
jgi:hypothetical protein